MEEDFMTQIGLLLTNVALLGIAFIDLALVTWSLYGMRSILQ